MRAATTKILSGATALLLGGTASASPATPSPTLSTREVQPGVPIYGCTVPGTIALAFDDGPYIYTGEALDILKEAGLPATFFVNGATWSPIVNNAREIQRILTEGHQLASHTWTHARLTDLNATEVRAEMVTLEETLLSMVGKYPTYMRPPFLAWNDEVLSVMRFLGYKVISNNLDTVDWDNNTPETWPNAVANFKAALDAGGSLVLFHDVHQTTVENLLPEMIKIVKERGLKAVTVGECLGDPKENWYSSAPRNGSEPLPPVETPTNPPVYGPNGSCAGPELYQCPPGQCCSQYNYCGFTADYCAAGCQPLYGRCD
ncbi:uncharacterized protein B0I36DRAFT_245464 [Microdochium trichocladiopsis]|uniref:Glycoside hydrolase/deacetylase n=1 Tax=Microdochium trichocladiopsis TaxID=1682393 RepID=A0A9P9BQ35_9PEZI|nr:uncharacterized protein B0I36DRAFT_245464 [Microdochium trichocladiopsis]KAH7029862.1 hypothetical protein B0I36DRAFT_245464 [Microdochium trichocladiopsis]